MRIAARVDETERGRLAVSQPVTLQLDAVADRQFTGKVERIGTIATSDFSAGWPIPRNFDLEIGIDQTDAAAQARNDRADHRDCRAHSRCHHHPRAGFLSPSGQTVAYVWNGSAFQERAIQVERRSRDRILISSGLKPATWWRSKILRGRSKMARTKRKSHFASGQWLAFCWPRASARWWPPAACL
jgi:HlyD family secretion protein